MDRQTEHAGPDIGQRITELRANGYTRKEILQIIGCSAHTISKYLATSDAAARSAIASNILRLRNVGLTFEEIRRQTGYAKSTISKWLRFSTHPRPDRPKQKKQTNTESINPFIHSRRLARLARGKALKQWLLELKSACVVCGYTKCKQALDFHHLDPTEKKFELSKSHHRSLSQIIAEINKCIILCKVHHVEQQHGIIDCSGYKPLDINITNVPDHVLATYSRRLAVELTTEVVDYERQWIADRLYAQKRIIAKAPSLSVDFSQLTIQNITHQKAFDILQAYHYLGGTKKGYIANFGLFHETDLLGVAVITNSVRQGHIDTCELSRFVLCVVCENLASKFLGLIVRRLKTTTKYKFLQSFAQDDLHSGAIYLAAGFRCSNPNRKKATYNYNGIHKKTIYERAISIGLSEEDYAMRFELTKIPESAKSRFVVALQ